MYNIRRSFRVNWLKQPYCWNRVTLLSTQQNTLPLHPLLAFLYLNSWPSFTTTPVFPSPQLLAFLYLNSSPSFTSTSSLPLPQLLAFLYLNSWPSFTSTHGFRYLNSKPSFTSTQGFLYLNSSPSFTSTPRLPLLQLLAFLYLNSSPSFTSTSRLPLPQLFTIFHTLIFLSGSMNAWVAGQSFITGHLIRAALVYEWGRDISDQASRI